MTRRREYPLHLQVSLESLPPPESLKREQRLYLRFTKEEIAGIERVAEERGEVRYPLLLPGGSCPSQAPLPEEGFKGSSRDP